MTKSRKINKPRAIWNDEQIEQVRLRMGTEFVMQLFPYTKKETRLLLRGATALTRL
jgi:hypothetical protein